MKLLTVILALLFLALASDGQSTEQPATRVGKTTQPTMPTQKPATVVPTTQPASKAHTEGKATVVPTTQQASKAHTEGKATVVPTTQPASTAHTQGNATVVPTTQPASTAHTQGNATVVPTTQPVSTAHTQGNATVVPTTVPTKAPATTFSPLRTWSVSDAHGNECILAQFYAAFSGTYKLKDKSTGKFAFNMPENAQVDKAKSRCGSATESAILALSWYQTADTFTLEFTMDPQTKMFQLKSANVSLTHTEAHFPNSSATGAVEYGGVPSEVFFKTELGYSYKCTAMEQIPFKEHAFAITFTDLRVQPFQVDKTFGKESHCPADFPAHWGLRDSKGSYCLLADFELTFTGEYMKKDKKMYPFEYVLPQNAAIDNATSQCGSDKEPEVNAILALTFDNGSSFTQVFQADNKTKTFSLVNATAVLVHSPAHFPDSSDAGKPVTYGGMVPKKFPTGLGSYYKCSAQEKVDFKTKDKFALSYTDVKIQPFDVKDTFGEMNQCSDDTPKRRPAVPPVGHFNISNTKGICMMMQFGAQFIISYQMGNHTKSREGYYFPNITVDTEASTCTDTKAEFVAKFSPEGKKTEKDWTMSLTFTMDKDKNYALTNFTLRYVVDAMYFPGVNASTHDDMTVSNGTKRYDSTAGNYYMCKANQNITAKEVVATFTEMKVQPFAQEVKKGGFGDPTDCAADNDVSNIVPIAVGCALAGLVIIVLIAYLIGRSRTNRSGYQSV
ncbi:lysosome-associated membrane glycoprotein 1-like [Acanthaster planci]|uniref:Lysosome-associated membrane glycoprotein 5 n=1 Tax=Acanthaster planci TaxID=133434 RepID=A0A8B7YM22_ACAPL|nr:lysosome-associated membrane glycoprotein 1-like [Acanthaster planci]